MKIVGNFVLALSLLIPRFFYSSLMPAYQNTIQQIQEISGATTYTLILTCDQQQPIAIYDPQTYQETKDNDSITITMPNTHLAGNIEVPEVIEVIDSAIKIHLEGRLKVKVIGAYKVFITMTTVE